MLPVDILISSVLAPALFAQMPGPSKLCNCADFGRARNASSGRFPKALSRVC